MTNKKILHVSVQRIKKKSKMMTPIKLRKENKTLCLRKRQPKESWRSNRRKFMMKRTSLSFLEPQQVMSRY